MIPARAVSTRAAEGAMAEDREGPLARWSRLKLRQGAQAGRGGAAPVSFAPDRDPAPSPAPDGGPPAALPAEAQPSGMTPRQARTPPWTCPPSTAWTRIPTTLLSWPMACPRNWPAPPCARCGGATRCSVSGDGLDDYDEDFSLMFKIVDAVTAKAAKAKSAAKAKRPRRPR